MARRRRRPAAVFVPALPVRHGRRRRRLLARERADGPPDEQDRDDDADDDAGYLAAVEARVAAVGGGGVVVVVVGCDDGDGCVGLAGVEEMGEGQRKGFCRGHFFFWDGSGVKVSVGSVRRQE